MNMVMCPYCDSRAKRVNGAMIFPHRPELEKHIFYSCTPCNARVGTHVESGEPLGTLANERLRLLRGVVHNNFDPIWKRAPTASYNKNRVMAYVRLASAMKIPSTKCHIGMFNEEQCLLAIDICKSGEI